MTALNDARTSLAEAHRCIADLQNRSPRTENEELLLCAIHALGAAMGAMCDAIEQLDGFDAEGAVRAVLLGETK
jgi:hypothetical protein